jgi:TetR/AcrR family transcriptional regulator, tetracycline repressor protein
MKNRSRGADKKPSLKSKPLRIKPTQSVGRPRGRRKSAGSLSADQIAAGALELLGRDGVDAFSVRNLAKDLGVSPATIYWYAQTRNDVLVAAAAYALRELEFPDSRLPWQEWVRELCRRFRRLAQNHRGVAKLIGSRLAVNAANIGSEIIESILRALTRAGFNEVDIVDAFNVVVVAMLGFTHQELSPEPEESEQWVADMRAKVNTVNFELHPLMARFLPLLSNRAFIVRWENGVTAPMEQSFEVYLDVVVRGLEALLESKRTTGTRGAADRD